MLSKYDSAALIAGILGAVLGALFAGVWGAVAGAILAWGIPFVASKFTQEQRLKKRILDTLDATDVKKVRDIMSEHGVSVPKDCFEYSEKFPFVQSLAKYRKALTELEFEGKVTVSKQASVSYGYVNPPNDWVNDWSGRAYTKSSKEL
jgi:hypothetical protein